MTIMKKWMRKVTPEFGEGVLRVRRDRTEE
jgi:hypothetical protein